MKKSISPRFEATERSLSSHGFVTPVVRWRPSFLSKANGRIFDAFAYFYMVVSLNGGTPIAGWFIREKSTKMDDLGVPLFSETTISSTLVSIKSLQSNCGMVKKATIWSHAIPSAVACRSPKKRFVMIHLWHAGSKHEAHSAYTKKLVGMNIA